MKKIFFLLTIFSTQFIEAQTFEKKFIGCWAETIWTFEFFKNGEYKRVSDGHYGDTTVSGKYIMSNDTIKLISGFEDTHGTVNEYYFIDKNNVLIDIKLEYGYPIYDANYTTYYCDLKYPKISPVNKEKVIQLEKVLNLAFNSEKMKSYYHFDKFPIRKLLIAKYNELQANIVVDNKFAEFKPIEEITEDFYFEIENISIYNEINIKIKIHGEGVRLDFTFVLTDNEWVEKETRIFEE